MANETNCREYPSLQCIQSGHGMLKTDFCASGQVTLQEGAGKQFPVLKSGQGFYAQLLSPCADQCEEVRVIATNGDIFTIERLAGSSVCFPVGSSLRYTSTSVRAIREIAMESVPLVSEPLIYDCATHTISIDCAKLNEMIHHCCGECDENNKVSGGGT